VGTGKPKQAKAPAIMSKMESQKNLGQLFCEDGYITPDQLKAAQSAQLAQEKSIGRVLVDMGLITEEAKLTYLNKKFGYEVVDISGMQIEPSLMTKIPRSYAEKFRCVPILVENGRLVMAMEDPTDLNVLDDIRSQSGMDVLPVLSPLADIERALVQYPALQQREVDKVVKKARPFPKGRLIHSLLFFLVMLAPLIALIWGAKTDSASDVLMRLGGAFDVALFGIVGWVVWAVIVWYLDGLLFRRSQD
jgi:hypothetical protein